MPAYNESSILVKSSVSRGTTFLYERCCNLFWDDEMQLQYLFYILIRKDIEIVSYYNCFHKLLLSHHNHVPCHQKDNFIKSHLNLRGFKVSIRKLILVIGTLITLFHADRMESSLASTAPWVPLVTSPFLCKQCSNWLSVTKETGAAVISVSNGSPWRNVTKKPQYQPPVDDCLRFWESHYFNNSIGR